MSLLQNLSMGIISLLPWPPGPELPLFYTDEPAQPCRDCYLAPVTGRVGDVFSIRCENAGCARRPQVFGRDEQQVRGIWLMRYGVRFESRLHENPN